MWHYNNTNEIYHHGILGQKWGVRRYQNKDGSLTPAGKRKAAKMKEEYTALTGKRLIRKPTKKVEPKNTGDENANRKQIKEMSATEIQNRIDRLEKEKRLATLQSETASKGEKFVTTVGKQVIAPSAIEAGKRVLTNWFEKQGKELMGLNPKDTKDALSALKDEVKELELERNKLKFKEDIERYKKKENNSVDEKTKETKSKRAGNIYDKDTKVEKPSKDTVIEAEWEDLEPDTRALVPYRRRK